MPTSSAIFKAQRHKILIFFHDILILANFRSIYEFSEFPKKSWLSDPNLFPRWIKGGGTHSRFPKNLKRYHKSREMVHKRQRNFMILLLISILDQIWPIYKFWKFSIFPPKKRPKFLIAVLDAPAPSSKEPWLGPRRTENFGFSENSRKKIFTGKTIT